MLGFEKPHRITIRCLWHSGGYQFVKTTCTCNADYVSVRGRPLLVRLKAVVSHHRWSTPSLLRDGYKFTAAKATISGSQLLKELGDASLLGSNIVGSTPMRPPVARLLYHSVHDITSGTTERKSYHEI
jgi:hypothetical protein